MYFLYRASAVFPFVKIFSIGAAFRRGERSFAVTLLMDASLEPCISHEAMTSQRASRLDSRKARFSAMLTGTFCP